MIDVSILENGRMIEQMDVVDDNTDIGDAIAKI